MSMLTQQQTTLGDTPITYLLERKRRKGITLIVNQQGLLLRTPLICSKKAIEQALSQHAAWIIRKLTERKPPAQLHSGGQILWLGNPISIITDAPRSYIDEHHCHLAAANTHEDLKVAIAKLYRQLALPYLSDCTAYWAEKMQLFPKKVLISSAQKRWGSCNSLGEIRFSWHLMHAPLSCIDYVVIHELAHLQEMNHSRRFWQIVESYCPDYRQTRKMLATIKKID